MASKNGLNFDLVCDKYHARGRLMMKSISVVNPASLNERMKGVRSRFIRVSSIFYLSIFKVAFSIALCNLRSKTSLGGNSKQYSERCILSLSKSINSIILESFDAQSIIAIGSSSPLVSHIWTTILDKVPLTLYIVV